MHGMATVPHSDVTRGSEAWEDKDGDPNNGSLRYTNEAPTVLKRHGKYYMMYSGGSWDLPTYALAYERNVVRAPDDLPLEILGPLGCGVQTGAGAIMRSLACEPGSSVLVTGGGPVGLSAVMGAKIQGCGTIILLEPHTARRALALEFGATHIIDPAASPDLAVAVRAILPGLSAEVDNDMPIALNDVTFIRKPHGRVAELRH